MGERVGGFMPCDMSNIPILNPGAWNRHATVPSVGGLHGTHGAHELDVHAAMHPNGEGRPPRIAIAGSRCLDPIG